MSTVIEDLFPGKMGKVELTRVAIRMRLPRLLKMKPNETMDDELVKRVKATLEEVRQG